MVGISSAGATDAEAEVLATTRAGSVLLLGNSTSAISEVAQTTHRARRAARPPDAVKTMLAVDQEGGLVQRLQGSGFERMPAAVEQARLGNRRLATKAEQWGRQLRRAGIDANLAPVADVVPAARRSDNEPIGRLRREYGSDPDRVGDKVRAFVSGMEAADVATAVKHFPGLGQVRGNTDFESKVTDVTTRRHDALLAGFAEGIDAGANMIMVSSATYTKIDPKRRAAFSSTVLRGMIRGDLEFTGVIISDDLAARAMSDVSPDDRVVRFVRAGGDLAILGDSRIAGAAAQALVAEARDDPAFAKLVAAGATRVVELKQRHGLASC